MDTLSELSAPSKNINTEITQYITAWAGPGKKPGVSRPFAKKNGGKSANGRQTIKSNPRGFSSPHGGSFLLLL